MVQTLTRQRDVQSILRHTRTLTFDCYGTLVDWKEGLSRAFVDLFGQRAGPRLDTLFNAYLEVEAEIEGDVFRTYREVLNKVSARLADTLDVTLDATRRSYLAETVPHWPLFADTREALTILGKRYRLGVLSNIDRDLFARTARNLDLPLDFLITAEDVRAYKPATAHFERMLEAYGTADTTLHVAQSLFHDGEPAETLGIPFAWINRYGQRNETDVQPAAEFSDLISLARMVDEL